MNIFIAFANQDRDVRDKLLRQMNLVAGKHGWNIWSAKEIKAGERWGDEIERRLRDSEVVILLLSTDFFNSEYIIEKELPEVVEKYKAGNCQIIPVIARVCHWKETPFGEYAELGDIQALPVGEHPIVSRGHWDNDDQPYFETVQGIRDSIKAFQAKKQAALAHEDALAIEAQKAKEAEAQRAKNERLANEKRAHEEQALREALREREAFLIIEIQKAEEALREREAALATEAQKPENDRHTSDRLAREKQADREKATPSQTANLYQTGLNPAVIIVGGLLFFLLVVLLLPKMCGDVIGEGSTSSQPITTPAKPTFADPFESQMVRISGGTFTMGSPATEQGRDSDECQHPATVKSFSIGKYEVTQAQWKAVMGTNPSKFKGCNDCPVEQVSWNDAQTFLKKLNGLTEKRYRLPTEAEWEYAALGVKKASDITKIYAGSNTLGDVAWYIDNSGSKTHPVGDKSPNELDIYDMSGNVWEWCQDFYKAYPNCKGYVEDGRRRVLRGGSWGSAFPACRAAGRISNEPANRDAAVGFRLVSVSLQ